MQAYAEVDEASQAPAADNFRKMEKDIRLFIKATCGGKAFLKQLKKSAKSNNRPVELPSLSACDVLDPRQPGGGLLEVSDGVAAGSRVLTLPHSESHPRGLFIIPGALSPDQQLHWARESLERYSTADHTNLSNLDKLRGEECTAELSTPSQKGIWEQAVEENNGLQRIMDLRWASLGYHYNWTDRCYQEDVKSQFPSELSSLCRELAQKVGCDLEPEAAIVNFYPVGSSMGGHLDDAELTMEQPIVSISIGRSAIFMIGGRTKDIQPVPILVRSGDVVVMSGESRYCYHGVPHILSAEEEECIFSSSPASAETFDSVRISGFSSPSSSDKILDNVKYYLTKGRVNINARQVVQKDGIWADKCGSGAMKIH